MSKQLSVVVLDALHIDASEGIFFARQLEHVKARTYDREYPALMAKQLIPVSTEAGPDVASITWRSFDRYGMAKIIANPADDLPSVGLGGEEHSGVVRDLGASYDFTIQEMRYANRNGIQLSTKKAAAARDAIELLEDEIGWFGSPEYGLQGFLTNPNVTAFVVDSNSGGTSTAWADKTPDEIIADVEQVLETPSELTNDVEMPDTLAIASRAYAHIAKTPRSSTSDTTILAFLQQVYPNVTFVRVSRLNTIASSPLERPIVGGGDTSSVMIAYTKSDDKLTFEICQPFEQLPPQARNLALVTNCTARNGGVLIYKPLSICIAEGI